MKRLFLLFILVLSFTFSQASVNIDDTSISPYYEQGVFLATLTDPFEVTTPEGMKGKIRFGVNTDEDGFMLVIIEPDSEIYDALYETFGEITEARLALYQQNPASNGYFPLDAPLTAYQLEDLDIRLRIKDGEEMIWRGSQEHPSVYNCFKMDYRGDENYIPLMLVVIPQVMESVGFFEPNPVTKAGFDWVNIKSGDTSVTIPLDDITPGLYNRLKKATLDYKE